jgi:hypothetical protein
MGGGAPLLKHLTQIINTKKELNNMDSFISIEKLTSCPLTCLRKILIMKDVMGTLTQRQMGFDMMVLKKHLKISGTL